MIDIGHDPNLPYKGYSYRKATINNKPIEQVPIVRRYIYTFTDRFNQKYIVNIEQYDLEVYIVKFHLKKDTDNKKKYQVLTGKGDVGRVLATCIKILLEEILYKNASASFGFIGINSEGEGKSNTKRFVLYQKIVSAYFSEKAFEHVFNENKSAYALLNRKNKISGLRQKVEAMFKKYYPLLEEDSGTQPPTAVVG